MFILKNKVIKIKILFKFKSKYILTFFKLLIAVLFFNNVSLTHYKNKFILSKLRKDFLFKIFCYSIVI